MKTATRRWLAPILAATMLSAPPAALASGWKLVFEDNFDGSALDRSVWATRYIYGNEKQDKLNDEVQRYRDNDNHVVKDGVLDLVARKTGEGAYESGMIRSLQTFYYGYYEARVKLPKGKGIWPAFWLNSDYDASGALSWPPEIDIMEYVVNGGEDLPNMVHSAAVDTPRGSAVTYYETHPEYNTKLKSFVGTEDLSDGWRVFGLVWTPTDYTVLLDGKVLYRRPYAWLNKSGVLAAPAHVLLNFAIGGSWAGRYGIDDSYFPQALSIDYVRVCQFSEASDAGARCGGSAYTPNPADYRYSAPGDMDRAVFGAAAIGDAESGGSVSLPAGVASVKVTSRLRAPSGVAATQNLYSVIKANGSGTVLSEQTTPLDGYDNGEMRTVVHEMPLPATVKPGSYRLVEAIVGKTPPAGASTPLKAPVLCGGAKTRTLTCDTTQVTVTTASY